MVSSSSSSSFEGSSLFRHRLPEVRLGIECTSYDDFIVRCFGEEEENNPLMTRYYQRNKKDYSLVVVTETDKQRILLGHKHRGFGAGMYNSFGGKLDPNETPRESAVRELREETGIVAPLEAAHPVGILRFTFCEDPANTEMVVHVFRVHVSYRNTAGDATTQKKEDETTNREQSLPLPLLQNNLIVVPLSSTTNDVNLNGCTDEITPYWFDDWHNIPLNNMFADDSIWLTRLLSSSSALSSPSSMVLDGWFHFQAGGAETNTILHYYLDVQEQEQKKDE